MESLVNSSLPFRITPKKERVVNVSPNANTHAGKGATGVIRQN